MQNCEICNELHDDYAQKKALHILLLSAQAVASAEGDKKEASRLAPKVAKAETERAESQKRLKDHEWQDHGIRR